MTVLGISTSSRVVGMAVMKDAELNDYKIRQFQQGWSDSKASRIIDCINHAIHHYSITSIAYAIPYEHYASKESKLLYSKIQSLCKKKRIAITAFVPSAFDHLCQAPKAKKKALMAW